MAIHKLKKHQDKIPYFMLSRDVVQNIKNPDSLAIWVYLQSQSDNWDIVEKNIKAQFNIGRTRYLAAMKELRLLGLYSVERFKDDNNIFTGSIFHIYATPQVSSAVLMESDTYIKEDEILKEEENEKEKESDSPKKPKKPKKKTPEGCDKPEEVEQEVWDDFIRQRNSIFSNTALKMFRTEAKKAGYTLNDAFKESVFRGWQSFKAEWSSVKQSQPNQTKSGASIKLLGGDK